MLLKFDYNYCMQLDAPYNEAAFGSSDQFQSSEHSHGDM